MIALPFAPEGSWNDLYKYSVCARPPGEMAGTVEHAHQGNLTSKCKGWVFDTFMGGAPRRPYVRCYHVKSGQLYWLRLVG